MDAQYPSASSGRSDPSKSSRGQVQFGTVTAALTGFCGLLIQQDYSVLDALLITLALSVGSTLTVRLLQRRSDDTDDGPGGLRWV